MTNEKMQEILNEIKEHFSNPENVEKFKTTYERIMNEPCFKQLQCDSMWCEHNRPEGFVEMGTITWCNKYKCDEEGCEDRTWKELIIHE